MLEYGPDCASQPAFLCSQTSFPILISAILSLKTKILSKFQKFSRNLAKFTEFYLTKGTLCVTVYLEIGRFEEAFYTLVVIIILTH
jgi:hypothetical protein